MIKVTLGNNVSRKVLMVSENTKLSDAIAQSGLDFKSGVTSMNGFSLSAADMNETFADLGVTDECFLMNVVKADNAASVQLVGDQMIVVTSHTREEWEDACEEDAMTLYEDEKKEKPYFAASYDGHGNGSLNHYGLTIGGMENREGKAIVIVKLPESLHDTEARIKHIAKNLAKQLVDVEAVEAMIDPAIARAKARFDAAAEKITVI